MPFFLSNKLISLANPRMLCFLLLLLPFITFAQVSNTEAYKKVVYQEMLTGRIDLFKCSETESKERGVINSRSKSQAVSCASAFQAGYGTNCWNSTNAEPDPACAIPPVVASDCNGGKYRIPIAITIFECFDWSGTNYLQTQEGGFEALLNMDLNARLIEVNALYANANIEFYEVNRQRIQDCDLYDFYQNTEPSTGFNDGNDDLTETESYDIPNVLNLYFVGGLIGDHDCCGFMAFAPYPPGRDYSVLRYGTAVSGSALAHELGHYFGLPHTYAQSIDFPVIDGDGVPTGSLDNCDCLTQGDRICDTWPDPRFSHNCNHLGDGEACYIKMDAESQCEFDEEAYAAHIMESHPGVSPTLMISPNSGTVISPTSSTVLNQNIMSNNLIFGCTTTFSPCQYKKVHDVARSDCRNYLCNVTTADYFANAESNASFAICVGDALPTFQPGNSITRFDGTQYALECFDWYMGEFDQRADAILLNSSSFTPTADQVNTMVAGTYEFWLAEVNALNDPPCKVKVTVTVQDTPGAAATSTNESTIDACTESNFTIEASGASINNTVDIIGWYFSNTNPTTLTTGSTAQTAIQTAMNTTTWNSATGNIIQSDELVSSLSNVSIDCNTLGGGTHFFTPFIAKGAMEQQCSASSNSSSFNWNIAGGLTGGATVNLGPINDCEVSGLSVDEFLLTLNILDCESTGGDIGGKIYFNRGNELTINTPLDFTFDCTQDVFTISGSELRRFKPDYDPMVDQIQINFINSNFSQENFQGTIALNLVAKIEVNYSGGNAQEIWDTNNSPNIDTSNMDCFWGDPITVLCNCDTKLCPEIGTMTGSSTICSGDSTAFLSIDSTLNMGSSNIEFVYFNNRQTDSSLYVTTPVGVLGTGLRVDNVSYSTAAGTYYVYAKLDTVPIASSCRPFQELVIEVTAVPSAPTIPDVVLCMGAESVELVEGIPNLRWYSTETSADGNSEAPVVNSVTTGTTTYWVSQSSNNCESERVPVVATINAAPPTPVVSNVNYFVNNIAIPLTAIGSQLRWYSNANETGTSVAPTPTTDVVGTQIYRVSQTINNCESEQALITVTVQNRSSGEIGVETTSPTNGNNGTISLTGLIPDTSYIIAYIIDKIGVVDTLIANQDGTVVITGLTAGSYNNITLTSSNGKTNIADIELLDTNSCALMAVLNGTSIICAGEIANVNLTISNGQEPYQLVLSNGINNFEFSNYVSGTDLPFTIDSTTTYTLIQLVDSDSCTLMESVNPITFTVNRTVAPIVSGVTYCQGEAAMPLTAEGSNLRWYAEEVGGTGVITIIPSTDSIGTQTYWVSQIVSGCESERVPVVTTINARPSIPVVSNVSYFVNDSAIPLTAIGDQLRWYTSASDTASSIAPTPTTNTVGTQIYRVSQTVNNCESEQALVTITIQERAFVAIGIETVSPTNGNNGSISFTGLLPDTSYILAYSIDTLTIVDTVRTNQEGTIILTGLTAGRYNDISLTFNEVNTSVANIELLDATSCDLMAVLNGTDSICAGAEAFLNISIANGQGPYQLILSDGSNNFEFSNYVSGTNLPFIIDSITTYRLIQLMDSDSCTLTNTVNPTTITVNSTAAPIVNGISYCQGEAAVNLMAEGTLLRWYQEETGGAAFNIVLPSTDSIGTQTYWVSQTINGCESDRSAVNVRVVSQPPPPTTNDTIVCMGTSIFLTAEGEQLAWYTSATGGSAVDMINSEPDVFGTQTYWVSQTVNGCESERARSVVSNISSGPAPGVSDISYFLNETAMPLMAFGNQLRWYTTNTSDDGTSNVPTPNTSILGVQTFWVSQMQDMCESERVPLNVTVRARINIGLGLITPPTNVANGSIQLTDLLVDTTYTLRYDVNGNTVTTTITTDTIGNYVITGLSAGNYTNIRVLLNGESSSSLEVALTPALCNLVATFSDNDTICQGDTSSISIVIENGTNPYRLTLREGNNTIDFPTYISGTSITIITNNTKTYSVASLEDNNGCTLVGADTTGEVTITVLEPMAPTTNDLMYCLGATGLPVLSAVGNNLLWYTTENGGIGSAMPPTPNATVAGTTSYWVSQVMNGCESPRARINVVVKDATPPPTVTPLTYCMGAAAPPISIDGTNVLWYTAESGGIGSAIAPSPNTDSIGTTIYWLSQSIDGCESPRVSIPVTINTDRPNPPIVEPITYCQGETPSPVTIEGENLKWYIIPEGGTATDTLPQPTTELTGRYYYWVSQTINGCESELARVDVTINEKATPEIGLVIPPSACLRNGGIQLRNLQPNQTYELSYRFNGRSITPYPITTTNIGTHIFSGLAAGSYTAIQVASGSCASEGLQQILEHDSPPSITVDFTGTANVCRGDAGALSLTIDGGTAPYKLLITDIFNTYSLEDYESGDPIAVRPTKATNYYLVSVIDSNGCRAMIEDGVVRMDIEDCTSMSSFEKEVAENNTNLFSLDAAGQRLKNSETLDLFQNKPNPFSSQTTIGFYLPSSSEVELILRDNTGKIIKRLREYGRAGENQIVVEDLLEANGLIYYQLITDFGTRSKKMLLVR